MRNMKKVLKLFCFAFITFLMLGFGGEKVSAQSITQLKKWYSNGTHWWARVKIAEIDNAVFYAFCLDSSRNVQTTGLTLDSTLYQDSQDKVNRIIAKAMELGLDYSKYSTEETNQIKMYGVTQAAVWYAVHGYGTNGYTYQYQQWVKNNNMTSIFNQLISASKSTSVLPSKVDYFADFSVSGNEEFTHDSNYWYLDSNRYYSINGNYPSSAKFTVSITNGEVSIDGTNWSSSLSNVAGNANIKVRVPYDATIENVKSRISFTSNNFSAGYDTLFYRASNTTRQNIGLIVPKTASVNNSRYISIQNEVKKRVEFQKIDVDTNKKVAGAILKLEIYENNEWAPYVTFQSTGEGNTNYSLDLPIGNYRLSEVKAPAEYSFNSTPVEFEIKSVNNELVVTDSDNQTISVVSISNKKFQVKFGKIQKNGDLDVPMSGIQIEVYNSQNNELFMCGITNDQGFFTNPCPGKENKFSSSQLYDYSEGTYYIKEISHPNGYYVGDFDDTDIDFTLSGKYAWSNSSNVRVTGNGQVVNVTIINRPYIDISKTNIVTGNEIPGATMQLYDLEAEENFTETDEGEDIQKTGLAKYVLLEEWTSTNTAHRIFGLEPNHVYGLYEEFAPEGYVRIGTEIRFKFDTEGNVTILDQNGEILTDTNVTTSAYKLTVPNDYTKVTISKTDMTTSEELAGAHIKLCTKGEYDAGVAAGFNMEEFACSLEEWDSTTEPHEIDMLAVGEYCLIETIAPSGYARKTSGVCFEVEEESGIKQVEFKNQVIRMIISKKNQVTGERIAGAKLQILNASDRSIAKTNTGAELTWISEADKDWEITGIPVGDYILVEIDTPEGYEEGMVIGEGGTEAGTNGKIIQEYAFSITGKENVDFELNVPVLNVPKTGLSTLNLFAIGGLLVFAGYETIKIYRKRVNS